MITKKEKYFIDKNATNFYHLVDYNSHFFGEPFLSDNYLYYFDGKIITIASSRLGKIIDDKSINKLIDKIIRLHSPENVIFWGETPTLDFNNQKGYKLKKENLELYKRELVFAIKNFKPSKKYRYYLNLASREGLKINFSKDSYYKAEHLDLLAKTHEKMLEMRSLSYYSIFPSIEKTKFVEIRKNEKLVSINIIIDNSPRYVCFAEVGYDKYFKRSSGVSKAMLIKHYLDKVDYISWGGSASEGIYNYKKELIGKTPFCFYENYIQYTYYKKDLKKRWLLEMKK